MSLFSAKAIKYGNLSDNPVTLLSCNLGIKNPVCLLTVGSG